MSDWKTTLKLVAYLDSDGAIDDKGVKKLTDNVAEAKELAEQLGCVELKPFATSAVRSAINAEAVLDHVEKQTGVRLRFYWVRTRLA